MSFKVIVLGATGGPSEADISGYLLYPTSDSSEGIVLDAGTLLQGLISAGERGNFKDFNLEDPTLHPFGEVFLKKIRGYLISHAHLDHIAALVINSQSDAQNKFVAGTDTTINDLRDHIFNAVIWPNYGTEGNEPILKKYKYVRLPLHEMVPLPNTAFKVEAHRLCHPHDYPSTAFLLEYKGSYVMYFGDTSPDALEKDKHLSHIWKRLAPLIREKKLRGIFLECSVPNEDSAQVIYGHLNPKLMMEEFHNLAKEVGGDLKGLKVIVSHRKESLLISKDKCRVDVELKEANDLGIEFIFPIQGDCIPL
ncbi:MAG: 3',5'-cyclic-nucleotide phosphodiesterase [Chlamydiales bacterium]|nr:3',5'-cyclic-nucleotide phosphodiesterase [Chlamydiales bacterium]